MFEVAVVPELSIGTLDYLKARIRMQVSSEHELTFRKHACAKEPWTVEFVESVQGGVFYDLGANVGSYTLVSIANGNQTVAFEPGFANYAALCRNLVLNQWLDRALVFPVAIGAQNGMVWFQYRDLMPGAASHVLGQPSNNADKPLFFHRQAVQLWKLDDIIKFGQLPLPTHLKIDTDGGEMGVLEGAAETLKVVRAIMLEMKPDDEPKMVKSLGELGFELKGRWDERGGKKIGVAYGYFLKPN